MRAGLGLLLFSGVATRPPMVDVSRRPCVIIYPTDIILPNIPLFRGEGCDDAGETTKILALAISSIMAVRRDGIGLGQSCEDSI